MLTVSDTMPLVSADLLTASTSTLSNSSSVSQSFEDQLLAIIESSLKSLGIDPGKLDVKLQSNTSTDASTSASQILVTYDTSATTTSSSTTSAASTSGTTSDNSFGTKTVNSLKRALTDAGMDPDEYNLQYVEELEYFPTGNFTCRFIKATLTDGSEHYYSANLTAECPSATVGSMQYEMTHIADGMTS
jgi:hypothetical protein